MKNQLPDKPYLRVSAKVYFYDTDAAGVVHNIAYLRMIELARSELAQFLGWKLESMLEDICPVVRRTEIDYLKPARLGEELVIEAELVNMERASFEIAFRLSRTSDDLLICTALQWLVTVDLNKGRPGALRQDWREKWPHLVGARALLTLNRPHRFRRK